MDPFQLQQLKNALSNIKVTFRLLDKAKKREKSRIEEDLTRIADGMIEQFNLSTYDPAIKDERYKTGFFITNVERIISAIELNGDN